MIYERIHYGPNALGPPPRKSPRNFAKHIDFDYNGWTTNPWSRGRRAFYVRRTIGFVVSAVDRHRPDE